MRTKKLQCRYQRRKLNGCRLGKKPCKKCEGLRTSRGSSSLETTPNNQGYLLICNRKTSASWMLKKRSILLANPTLSKFSQNKFHKYIQNLASSSWTTIISTSSESQACLSSTILSVTQLWMVAKRFKKLKTSFKPNKEHIAWFWWTTLCQYSMESRPPK